MAQYDVFISHSSIDTGLASQVCAFLERNGIKCWIAPRDIAPGAAYPSEITRGIKTCKVFLVILTAKSVSSAHVNTETDIAFNDNKIIIPYFVEKADLDDSMAYYLARKQWILGYPDFRKSLPLLLTSIRNELSENFNEFETQVPPVPNPPASEPPAPKLIQKLQPTQNRNLTIIALAILGAIVLWIIIFKAISGNSRNEYQPQQNQKAHVEEAKTEIVTELGDYYTQEDAPKSHELTSITRVDNNKFPSRWSIENEYSLIAITADIYMPYDAYDQIYCRMRLHIRTLDGIIETPEGENIGFIKSKISKTAEGEYTISGTISVHSANYNYSHKQFETTLLPDAKTCQALDKEMTISQ